ncbi:hypothetical protein BDP55DRAFT_648821 [Colletotrichum godetiae]|uniref:Uncharacterized protein n=1 Tax=Colletotrichum godetiae TaxID=1209918 RepID=A0AAJ0AV08_9PEZI|nr:uncharacterized protein BDP55DRAFT_648821 [Colletotrichum godetiae]KAK1690888.1 hypothetical protein BDP55DRAFT_648821 [Colletotrichum godetiae]
MEGGQVGAEVSCRSTRSFLSLIITLSTLLRSSLLLFLVTVAFHATVLMTATLMTTILIAVLPRYLNEVTYGIYIER